MAKRNKPSRILVAGPHPVYILRRGAFWHISFSINGKETRYSLKEKEEGKARRKAKKISSELYEGSYGEKTNDVDIKPLIKKFLEFYKITHRKNTWITITTSLNKIVSDFQISSISDITANDFEAKMVEEIRNGKATRTVNKHLINTKAFLTWALERNYISNNPLEKLKTIKGERKKIRRALNTDETKKLLKVSSKENSNIWEVFLLTGMRKNEFITLRVSDVDLKKKVFQIRASISKNKTQRSIRIHKSILYIFKKALSGKTAKDNVFTNGAGTEWDARGLLRQFEKCRTLAKIKDPKQIDIHSLRVTFCTNLAKCGIHPKIAMEFMGHKSIEMTMNIYTMVELTKSIKAIDRLPAL